MGATAFERMRRVNAANQIVGMLKEAGCSFKAFREELSLQCEATEAGMVEGLATRTNHVELIEFANDWVTKHGKRKGKGESDDEPQYSEAVLATAQDLGVDLATVVGTGKNGNVIVKDVKAAAQAMSDEPEPGADGEDGGTQDTEGSDDG